MFKQLFVLIVLLISATGLKMRLSHLDYLNNWVYVRVC